MDASTTSADQGQREMPAILEEAAKLSAQLEGLLGEGAAKLRDLKHTIELCRIEARLRIKAWLANDRAGLAAPEAAPPSG